MADSTLDEIGADGLAEGELAGPPLLFAMGSPCCTST